MIGIPFLTFLALLLANPRIERNALHLLCCLRSLALNSPEVEILGSAPKSALRAAFPLEGGSGSTGKSIQLTLFCQKTLGIFFHFSKACLAVSGLILGLVFICSRKASPRHGDDHLKVAGCIELQICL